MRSGKSQNPSGGGAATSSEAYQASVTPSHCMICKGSEGLHTIKVGPIGAVYICAPCHDFTRALGGVAMGIARMFPPKNLNPSR